MEKEKMEIDDEEEGEEEEYQDSKNWKEQLKDIEKESSKGHFGQSSYTYLNVEHFLECYVRTETHLKKVFLVIKQIEVKDKFQGKGYFKIFLAELEKELKGSKIIKGIYFQAVVNELLWTKLPLYGYTETSKGSDDYYKLLSLDFEKMSTNEKSVSTDESKNTTQTSFGLPFIVLVYPRIQHDENKIKTLQSQITNVKVIELTKSKFYKKYFKEFKKISRKVVQKKECYKNAYFIAENFKDVKYVEGFFSGKGEFGDYPFEHAFNYYDGEYFDITLDYDDKVKYFVVQKFEKLPLVKEFPVVESM